MAVTTKKAAAEDVNVMLEDQPKINKFARNTSRITELKEEIEDKKKQLRSLEDACDDVMMLDDDSLLLPYQIGDIFISHPEDETQEMLEEAKKNLQEEFWSHMQNPSREYYQISMSSSVQSLATI